MNIVNPLFLPADGLPAGLASLGEPVRILAARTYAAIDTLMPMIAKSSELASFAK